MWQGLLASKACKEPTSVVFANCKSQILLHFGGVEIPRTCAEEPNSLLSSGTLYLSSSWAYMGSVVALPTCLCNRLGRLVNEVKSLLHWQVSPNRLLFSSKTKLSHSQNYCGLSFKSRSLFTSSLLMLFRECSYSLSKVFWLIVSAVSAIVKAVNVLPR